MEAENEPMVQAEAGNPPSLSDQSNMLQSEKQVVPPTAQQGPSSAQVYESQPMSKNALKKLKRQQKWDEEVDLRRARRKEKVKEKRERKRELLSDPKKTSQDPSSSTLLSEGKTSTQAETRKRSHARPRQLPVSLIIDCSFDDFMTEKEIKSLAAQVTRSYSENSRTHYRAHLMISSYGGALKERFEGVLASHHQGWKGVRFLEEDYAEAASQARKFMRENGGGEILGALKDEAKPVTEHAEEQPMNDVVYLTSDSPDTLTEISPYTTYVIGGIVDRNRHKGICYKRAMDRGFKTAKLPIGDFMKMSSRFVLATNHVVEIMLRWLELGDWGEAFLRVVPKRKGGVLKESAHESETGGDTEEGEDTNEASNMEDIHTAVEAVSEDRPSNVA
ncbi:MAG: hypothetical protein M4579_003047 [Chaenotheca gracillima]|nr:MAG: hypothetical protein M4579_003047 [Chaenotheca gracillima]